eukprot:12688799-Alexandrium_andersonii.AAC.1
MSAKHTRAPMHRMISTWRCPPDVSEPGMCAKRNRSLCGTRAAPARWEALCTTTLQGLGLIQGKESACCFCRPDRDLRGA